jgi:hypothetical protein
VRTGRLRKVEIGADDDDGDDGDQDGNGYGVVGDRVGEEESASASSSAEEEKEKQQVLTFPQATSDRKVRLLLPACLNARATLELAKLSRRRDGGNWLSDCPGAGIVFFVFPMQQQQLFPLDLPFVVRLAAACCCCRVLPATPLGPNVVVLNIAHICFSFSSRFFGEAGGGDGSRFVLFCCKPLLLLLFPSVRPFLPLSYWRMVLLLDDQNYHNIFHYLPDHFSRSTHLVQHGAKFIQNWFLNICMWQSRGDGNGCFRHRLKLVPLRPSLLG